LGVTFAAVILLLAWINYEMFKPYLLIVIIAGLFANALRPVRDQIYSWIDPAGLPSMSEMEKKKIHQIKQMKILNGKNMVLVGSAILALLLLRPMTFVGLFAFTIISLFLCVLSIFIGRVLVLLQIVDPRNASAGLAITGLVGCVLTLLIVFSAGITQDLLSGATDGAKFLITSIQSDPERAQWLENQIEMAQAKMVDLAHQNTDKIEGVVHKASEITGMDCMQYVKPILNSVLGDIGGNSSADSSVVPSEISVQIDMQVIKQMVLSQWDTVKHQLPSSFSEAKDMAMLAKERFAEYDVEKYLEIVMKYAQKVASGIAGFFSGLIEAVSSLSNIGSFLAFLFLFLRSETTVMSLLTNILPFTTKTFNQTIEIDLRVAFGTVFWVTIWFFFLHVLFVWVSFSALNLNFEYLAALLAGLAGSLPFLPPPYLFTLVLSAPQLAARRRWVELILLPLLHMMLGDDRDDLLEKMQDNMTFGKSILNYELLTAASVLGGTVFGQSGTLIGPLLISFSFVLYEVFTSENAKSQDRREALNSHVKQLAAESQ